MSSSEPGLTTRHTCHCGKSFIRKEHLTRHQATHNKPTYVCSICQRHFTRKDLLRRHSALHEAAYTRKAVSCDACRANKTKCSGGTRCALCTRRGIECVYRGSSRVPKMAPETAATASVSEELDQDLDDGDGDDDGEETSPTSSKATKSLSQELSQRNVKFLQNLTIVPSQSSTANFPLSSHGMGAIFELLIADSVSFDVALQECKESKAGVSKYIDTYIKTFHLRWPVLHAPILDNEIGTMSLPLAAAACLIGAWFQNSADWTERFYALRVHEVLLERLLHSLIEPELTSEEKPWPIELFQTVLLTLIFSLYRTDKNALSRAMLLRSTFITVLRELGVLDGEKFATHLKTYNSGTFTPYTLAMREKFKRLLVLSFQFDTYFALIHGKPPLLYLQEVSVGLPSTFALWNAYGLDLFALRELQEPHERSRILISEITSRSDSVISSGLLVEDVQLGLCSILQAIWVLSPTSPSKKENPNHSFQKPQFIQTIDDWKNELDKINKLVDPGNSTGNAPRYLLLAYRGEDDSVARSLERINTLVQDALILYYYLKMSKYLFDVVGLGKRIRNSPTDFWKTSKNGRKALICALQMLKIVESKASFNPLIRHALALGVDVMRGLLSGQDCQCLNENDQHTASKTLRLQHWSDTDGLCIDGTPVCACKLTFWAERFEKAIQAQIIMVE